MSFCVVVAVVSGCVYEVWRPKEATQPFFSISQLYNFCKFIVE